MSKLLVGVAALVLLAVPLACSKTSLTPQTTDASGWESDVQAADTLGSIQPPDAPGNDTSPALQSDAPSADTSRDSQTPDAPSIEAALDTRSPDTPTQDARPCTEIPCLGGHRYVYDVKQVWTPAGGNLAPVSDSDYQPANNGGSYLLSFSPDGQNVVVARIAGSNAMEDGAGAVAARTDKSATYKLRNNWAGAELTVSFGNELGGQLTVNGSGLPIVESTRGTMSLTEGYAPVGEACALPPVQPYDGYLSSTYADVVASTSTTPVTCAGLRDGYCHGQCAGWLVAIIPWRDPLIAAAYDPVTQKVVGWKTGSESYGICRGTFPPMAADGSPGWNPTKMDRNSGCK